MARRLDALLVEDSEADAELIAYELRRAGYDLHLERVDEPAAFAAALERSWDIVLCDHGLPSFSSSDAHRLMLERGSDVPFVIVSGLIGEEAAVTALELGARDVVPKANLGRLGPVVERELVEAENRRRQREAERALQESEERFRRLAEHVPDVIYRFRLVPTRGLEYISPSITAVTGYTPEEYYADPDLVFDLLHADDRPLLEQQLRTPRTEPLQLRWISKDGEIVWTESRSTTVVDEDGTPVALEGVARDITDRKCAEDELARLAALVEFSNDAIIGTDVAGEIVTWNPAAERIYGFTTTEAVGEPVSLIAPDERGSQLDQIYETVGRGKPIERLEMLRERKDGEHVEVEVTISPVRDGSGRIVGASEIGRDIGERKRAEKERASLEAQLRHAQEMEAVGRLAGGIAHDFNNLLMVVMGTSELLLRDLDRADPLRPGMEEIRLAGKRAVSLTSQLLAFSRQHRVQASAVNLNEVVAGIEEMLRRLIGEDVDLTTRLDPELGSVQADAGQLEQVIMNLAVNARDAMPSGGMLLIETERAEFDGPYAHPDGVTIDPGRYVVLSVADTGIGMDEATRSQAFEPFFTTKEPGKGTGLGLATVYGIVQQCQGYVWVASAPGEGTRVQIYLPRIEAEAIGGHPPRSEAGSHGGAETILLVEDEDAVRRLIQRILESAGYRVIPVANGDEALEICRSGEALIDLVLTDMVLPGMNGVEIARRLRTLQPTLRTLFMSGYTDRAVSRMQEAGASVGFLEKPFDSGTLMSRVREALDQASPLAAGRG
jgi:two-component system cell cycle sensor histidine kinase/response regulator CckA